MELWLGPGHSGSAFESDEHRRAMWFRYRDRIMRQWAKGGRRPVGWWLYEAHEKGLRYPTSQYERSVLWEAGVLGEEERAQLESEWKREWERCWDDPHFFHCAGPGKNFTGDEARVRHLIWADVPPALVDKWLAERERRGRVDLETEAASADAKSEAEPWSRARLIPRGRRSGGHGEAQH